jgi:AcrR family transcriptional regulator
MSLRQINRQKTRLAILDAAGSLIADSAWYSITTRQIAEAAQVSYQTLYNYFPSKAEIVRALIVETYVGPEEDMLNIIKRYEDDLLASINEINAARFNSIQATDPQWWTLIGNYFAPGGDGSYSGANILELVDQSGDSYYYQLLRQAQGTGRLRLDVDIQLMAHTLYCIANSAGERLIFAEANAAALQAVLADQSAQLVTPYLTLTDE